MKRNFIRLAPLAILMLSLNAAHADGNHLSTMSTDDASLSKASGDPQNNKVLGAIGLGGVAATNSVNGNSAGVVAQIRLRSNGRGLGGEQGAQGLYDTRVSGTYNVISSGDSGVSTTLTLRGEAMLAGAVQDIRNSCSIYAGGGAYGRAAIATANNGGANSLRFFIGPETGLACDISGIMLTLSPSVGFGAATNASQSLTDGPIAGGTSIMAGGVLRLSVNDRLHLSGRVQSSIPKAEITGGPSANMTMVGADVDVRVSDKVSVGLDFDGIQYAKDPGTPMRNEGTITGVVTAVF